MKTGWPIVLVFEDIGPLRLGKVVIEGIPVSSPICREISFIYLPIVPPYPAPLTKGRWMYEQMP